MDFCLFFFAGARLFDKPLFFLLYVKATFQMQINLKLKLQINLGNFLSNCSLECKNFSLV